MRYILFLAFLFVSFYSKGQYTSSQALLKDTNIVWAGRFSPSLVPFNYVYWQEYYNYQNIINPLKFINVNQQQSLAALGGNFDFLLDAAFWEANPKRFFSDDSLRKAADFANSCLMPGAPIDRTDLNGDIISQATKIPYDPSNIYSYQMQLIVYYHRKNQRWGCYLESIAPNGLSWNAEIGEFGEQGNLFFFNTQSSNLKQALNVQDAAILQAVWCELVIPVAELQPIIEKWSLANVFKSYFKSIRESQTAQKRLKLTIPNEYILNPDAATNYKSLFLKSLGYYRLLGMSQPIIDPAKGQIGEEICTEKNAMLLPKENIQEFRFSFRFYLNDKQQFFAHWYEYALTVNNPDFDSPATYLIETN